MIVTVATADPDVPLLALAVQVTVKSPAEAPCVLSVAVEPLPVILPDVLVQLKEVIVDPFGAVAEAVMMELSPRLMTEGFAEQFTFGKEFAGTEGSSSPVAGTNGLGWPLIS